MTSRASARRVPVLADVRPSGRYLMSELIAIGGIQPLMKRLLDAGLLHGDCLTVTGRTMAREPRGRGRLSGRPGHRPARVRPDQEGQPSGCSLRQPRARGRRGEDHGQGRPVASRAARGCSTARRRATAAILAGKVAAAMSW